MKIYTKTGDDGTTGLIGGKRVPKSDPRVNVSGTIDELNAAIGMASAVADMSLLENLQAVQDDLFVIGSHLANPNDHSSASLPVLDDQMVHRLEAQIDAIDATLPPLQQFILPGGTESAARLHLARAICRRAERLLVELTERSRSFPVILSYLNRLSDWLFVHARWSNQQASVPDIPWKK